MIWGVDKGGEGVVVVGDELCWGEVGECCGEGVEFEGVYGYVWWDE